MERGMRWATWSLMAMAIVAAVYAMAAEPGGPTGAAPGTEMKGAAPASPMGRSAAPAAAPGPMGAMPEEMHKRMLEAGISDQMMQQQRALMSAPQYLDSPSLLLAQAQELALTDEQKTKLEAIAKDAREKAGAVLTPDQKSKLGQVPEKPVSPEEMMMQMREKMRPVMEKMMRESQGGPMQRPMMSPPAGGEKGPAAEGETMHMRKGEPMPGQMGQTNKGKAPEAAPPTE